MARLTNNLLTALRHLEGLPGGKPALKAYQDIAGKWTNGYGHTEGVHAGLIITAEQAEDDLRADASKFADAVDELVTVPLNDNQRDALILFAYNNGIAAFKNSTLLRLLNAGNYEAVPSQLARWVYFTNPATGKKEVSNGLSARRAAETTLWLTPPAIIATPATVLAVGTHDSGSADVPPEKVTQTRTGQLQIGALATGGAAAIVQGYQQATPILQALQSASQMTASLPQWLKLLSLACIVISMGCAAWTLWHKARSVKENAP